MPQHRGADAVEYFAGVTVVALLHAIAAEVIDHYFDVVGVGGEAEFGVRVIDSLVAGFSDGVRRGRRCRAGRAYAEYLDGVIDLDEAMESSDVTCPAFDGAALDFFGVPAPAADQVVVMRCVPRGAAQSVDGLSVRVVDGVDQTVVDECLEVAIDSGEPDALTCRT